MVHIFGIAAGSYLIMCLFSRASCSKLVTAYVFIYLSSQHIYKIIFDYGGWRMDTTTFTMIEICRIQSLACIYTDGGIHNNLKLHPHQVKNKLYGFPSLLEFSGYTFFVGGAICGPWFEYKDYIRFIEKTGEYTNTPFPLIPTLVRFG